MIPQTPRVHSKPNDNTLPEQTKLRHRLRENATNQAKLPHRHNMQPRQQEQRKRVNSYAMMKPESTSTIGNWFEIPNTKKYGTHLQPMNLEDSPKE